MRHDNQYAPCSRFIIRRLRVNKPSWGSQTIKHSNGKWAGIWPNGVCRAIEPGHANGRFSFLSLLAKDKHARLNAVIAYRHNFLARISARKLP